jgi:hypothetical protein
MLLSPREKKTLDWRHNDRPTKPWDAAQPKKVAMGANHPSQGKENK